jgi:Phosphoserine phosphatase RsbU, N-terminal domain
MTDDVRDRFEADYSAAFSRYLSRRDEGDLAAAYEIGRAAVARAVGLLDLSSLHHAALVRALKNARGPADVEDRALAASEFFSEVLATFEMTQRGYLEGIEPGMAPRRARPRR